MVRRRSAARSCARRVAASLTLLCAACAVSGGDPAAGEIIIAVENDLVPLADLTVRVESDTGFRRMLGGVQPGATSTLRFREPSYGGRYRLIAQRADGTQVTSLPFALFAGAVVRWSLRDNVLNVGGEASEASAAAAGAGS